LSLLPANPDPFTLGPRDYLHDFMTLLSVLRKGDNRFLPLLLSKVHDVLPRLINPMLQTVPDAPANAMCDVDIFDGFGNAGIGVPSQFPGYNGNGTSGEFKVEHPEHEYGNRPSANIGMASYDKRIEDLGSPVGNSVNGENSPFTSPPMMQSPMEFPGLGEYGTFPDLSSPPPMGNNLAMHNHNGNFGEGVGGGGRHHPDFKRQFEGTMSLLRGQGVGGNGMIGNSIDGRRPPIRQGSGSNYGTMPRSVPDQYHHLQRANSGGEGVEMGMGGGGEMPFR
jgi:hypothetical protein